MHARQEYRPEEIIQIIEVNAIRKNPKQLAAIFSWSHNTLGEIMTPNTFILPEYDIETERAEMLLKGFLKEENLPQVIDIKATIKAFLKQVRESDFSNPKLISPGEGLPPGRISLKP